MKQLSGKTALITGASSGIGRSVAKLFAEQGANVVVMARREKELSRLVGEIRELGGRANLYVGNVAEEKSAKEMVDFTLSNFGALDIAVNNAGMLGPSRPVEDISLSEWLNVINTNLSSAFLAAKYQVPAMRESGGGSIVLVSSFVGYTIGLPNMSAYSASKAGIIGLAKALASECAQDGIRVNALLPGGTDTPRGPEASNTPEAIAFVESIHAMKRLAKPEEIAKSALYLASENSSFSTGTALLVDGGVSINKT
jgi:NAD(P)-dependent dehydrogenase (short-subunit alcohol dehydrogenase family)